MEPDHASATDPEAPSGAELPPAVLDGWYVLHQLYRIDWPAIKAVDGPEARRLLEGFGSLLAEWSGEPEAGWSGAYRMVGGGVDLMLLHFRESLDELTDASHEMAMSDFADFLILDHEYLSVVELGMYGLTVEVASRIDTADPEAFHAAMDEALATEREKAFVRRRLYPRQPQDMPYVCYYPMDKRRSPGQNWYALPMETRARLMRDHGVIGRRYAGRISQVISGSIGLADWEWAVTLWTGDPLTFKEIITEMRYDAASAEYAEFGRFFVGRRMGPEDAGALLGPRRG